MNTQKIVLAMIVFSITINIVNAETYIVYTDDILGFYKVRDVTTPTNKFAYEKRTLEINQGDTIIWQNDAEKTTFTISSTQGLWDNAVGYLRVGSKINYKFDVPGKYTFNIKEYPSRTQTIIVNSIDGYSMPTNTPTITETPAPTTIPTTPPTETVPIPIETVSLPSTINDITMNNTPTNIQGIKFPIKTTPTAIVSIIIAMLSIFITYKVGKNKKR